MRRNFEKFSSRFQGPRMVRQLNGYSVYLQICIRQCDSSHGKSGELVLQAILPVLLDVGITHHVPSVRAISLQTVSQLVTIAGSLLKPSLVTLIPALLSATDMESPKLTYMSTMFGAQSEVQEAIDSVRASAAKSHHATETITKVGQTLYRIFGFRTLSQT